MQAEIIWSGNKDEQSGRIARSVAVFGMDGHGLLTHCYMCKTLFWVNYDNLFIRMQKRENTEKTVS